MRIHTSCPSCTCQLDHPSQRTIVDPPRDEIGHLNTEIQRTDAAIQQLYQKRSTLLGRVNALQSSTKDIPPEVLSYILRYACPPVEFYDQPQNHLLEMFPPVLQLAAVCSVWRQVVISIPELWTRLSIDLMYSTLRKDAAIMKMFVENAKTRPLSLKLNFQFYDHRNFGLDWTTKNALSCRRSLPNGESRKICFYPCNFLPNVLREFAGKIKVLHIENMPFYWACFMELQAFDALTDLCIQNSADCGAGIPSLVGSLPSSLRHLTIRNFLPTFTLQSPANITVLRLEQVVLEAWLPLLAQCLNLQKLSIIRSQIKTWDEDSAAAFTENITLAHVEELEVHWHADPYINFFLQRFEFPGLRKLRWRGLCDTLEHGTVSEFLDNLPDTMSKLEIVFTGRWHSPEMVSEPLSHMFYHFSDLKELLVEVISPGVDSQAAETTCIQSIRGVLEALEMKYHDDIDDEDVLPSLSSLSLKMVNNVRGDSPQLNMDCTRLTEMLVARVGMGVKNFCLFWDGSILPNYQERELLRGLVDNGLSIEVIRRSERVGVEFLLAI